MQWGEMKKYEVPHIFVHWVEQTSTAEVAQLLGVTDAAVRHWRNGTRQISPELAVRIERATKGKIQRESLRPDLFLR